MSIFPDAYEAQDSSNAKSLLAYAPPPPYPHDLCLKQRIALEPTDYEPVHHAGTGVDEMEVQYVSELVNIDEAMARLRSPGKYGKGAGVSGEVMADAVRRGWEGVVRRMEEEKRVESREE